MSRKYNRLSWQATVQEVEGMRSGTMRNSALKLYCCGKVGARRQRFLYVCDVTFENGCG